MDLIGRGQCSIQAAAEIARDVAPGQQNFLMTISHSWFSLVIRHGIMSFQLVTGLKHDDCNVNPGFKTLTSH